MKLSNNSTPVQSVEIVDPEGSCKKDDYKAVFSFDELTITDVSDIDDWDDYAIDSMWEMRVAYYLPEFGIWRLWFREDAWE